ncbi:amidohydrolase family protein [Bradyrhizobium elkanii]|uniref:amidohydrolase family protein n=1 Tax=Bradyrhizobium elkanii TaxID=29448 RepID=UPI0005719948|nr:amidohydrolase family protein [Bradyrhizobium elkanii]
MDKITKQAGRIDVHHHFLSPGYVDRWGWDRLGRMSAAGQVARWNVDLSLELMALAGVATSIMSISSPGWLPGDADLVTAMCRETNEAAATLVRDHPGRFGMFGNLPMPHLDATLTEIAYTLDELGADGVSLFTNYAGRHLGDPAFDPVMEELSRRGAVVFVHPITPPGGKSLAIVSESTLDYPFETTRAIVNLLYHGVPLRYPGIRFIFSHAGGVAPYLAGRIAAFSDLNPKFQQRGAAGVIPALRGFWYDVTQSVNPSTFAGLRAVVPPDKLLFGTDVPFARKEQISLTLRDLPQVGLRQTELEGIDRANALVLFPRLREDRIATPAA